MPHIIRVLLFLDRARFDEWKKDRLCQQEGVFSNETEKKRFIGQCPHYPMRGVDMFHNDQERYISKHNRFTGDVYIIFIDGLHVYDSKQRKETFFVVPNENSGGIDFTTDNKKIKKDGGIQGKADVRWFPMPLPNQSNKPEKTYIVINHPELACEKIKIGTDAAFDTQQFSDHEWNTRDERFWAPKKRSIQYQDVFLTGGQSSWCQELFAYVPRQGINLFEPFFV